MEDERTLEEARKHLAHYRAGLNYRRGYLDALKELRGNGENRPEDETFANAAVRKFMEELR